MNAQEILWLYKPTEPGLWTVGYRGDNGKWYAESDWRTPEEAARRAQYLNEHVKQAYPGIYVVYDWEV